MNEQHDPALVNKIGTIMFCQVGLTSSSTNDWASEIIDAVRAWDWKHRPRGIVCAQCHGTGIVAVEDLELPPEPSDDEDRHTKRCLLFPSVSYYHEGCDGCFCVHGVCQECGAMLILRDAVKANESATPEP